VAVLVSRLPRSVVGALLGRRGLLSLAAFGLLIAAALRLLLPTNSPSAAVRATLEQVLADAGVHAGETPGPRDQRVQATLAKSFADPVTLRYVDMPRTGAGRDALLLWARLLGKYKTAELTLSHFELVQKADRALAKVDVRLDAQGPHGNLTDQRAAEITLVQRGDRWIIEAIDVVAGNANLPEARP